MLIRCAICVSIFYLIFSINGFVSASPSYCVTDLGDCAAYSINNSGAVVGEESIGGISVGFLYTKGNGKQYFGTGTIAFGINDNGNVVGVVGGDMDNDPHAFFYSGSGSMQNISLLPDGGYSSNAQAINNNGQITGWTNRHAFLCDGNSPMMNLGTLGGVTSWACDLNNQGQVVGYAQISSGAYHAFLWQNGSGMQDLGTLGGTDSRAYAINNSGLVVGHAYTSNGGDHAFLWQNGSGMKDLGTFGGKVSWANGINNGGLVVGTAYTSDNTVFRAFLYDGSTMIDLNSLIDSSSGWTLKSARAINDLGQIVGYGTSPSGQQHGFLLTPVPEPFTIVLLSIGAICLFGFIRQRSGL